MAAANNVTSGGFFTPSSSSLLSSFIPSSSSSIGSTSQRLTTSIPPTTLTASSSSVFVPSSQSSASPSNVIITSFVTPSSTGGSQNSPSVVVITSTASDSVQSVSQVTRTVVPSSSNTKTSDPALATSGGQSGSSSGGLSAPGKIAVAVVVPVVAVALIVIAALLFWRKRKQRKDAEELRRKEVEEYGFNPNHDPTLPVIGGASSNGGDDHTQMTETDGAGYRGWGTTSTARKPSTTLGSAQGPIGIARSTSGSDTGRFGNVSPTGATNKSSDVNSNDPLVGSPPNGRPLTDDSETVGALGAVPSSGNQHSNMHRGPSNASSAYSGAHHSDTSGEGTGPGGAAGPQYYNDNLYYDESMPQHGPYGDGSYGGGQPVIRDVPARRNTRIESPTVFPQQGSAGISQNF